MLDSENPLQRAIMGARAVIDVAILEGRVGDAVATAQRHVIMVDAAAKEVATRRQQEAQQEAAVRNAALLIPNSVISVGMDVTPNQGEGAQRV